MPLKVDRAALAELVLLGSAPPENDLAAQLTRWPVTFTATEAAWTARVSAMSPRPSTPAPPHARRTRTAHSRGHGPHRAHPSTSRTTTAFPTSTSVAGGRPRRLRHNSLPLHNDLYTRNRHAMGLRLEDRLIRRGIKGKESVRMLVERTGRPRYRRRNWTGKNT